MLSLAIIWEEFLKIIKEEAGSQVVETWFKAVSFQQWDQTINKATLSMPNQFVRNWVRDHYHELLKTHLCRLLQAQDISFEFICSAIPTHKHEIIPAKRTEPFNQSSASLVTDNTGQVAKDGMVIKSKQNLARHRRGDIVRLKSNYNFDSFVVGPSNSLAHAAAYAVSQSLGSVYNPLFIYGSTGLGKTHLLHAIGNQCRYKYPDASIYYETSDQFMNSFINAIRFDKINQFREKYRRLDLLLLDDVQFFSKKEQTQETFFHIFNMLYENQKQIVLSSDTYPKEIKGLEKRLTSRLSWGLVVDIQLPDIETKIAILKKKAKINNIVLSDDVMLFIASRIMSNIRELEGSLIRVEAFASLTNKKISINLTKRVLQHLPEEKKEEIMLDNVLKIVAKSFHISIHEIRSKKRKKDIVAVRQVVFYMMKKVGHCSLQEIGGFVGGRDHSTVLHAIAKIEKRKKDDSDFAQKLKILEQEIRTY